MRDVSSDVIVLRSVYLPKALDDKIRSAAFQADLDEGDLIARLIEEGLVVEQAVDGAAIEAHASAAAVVEEAIEEGVGPFIERPVRSAEPRRSRERKRAIA